MATLTTMLAQDIIFTVLGYVPLFIAVVDETERKDTPGQADSNFTTDDNNSVNVVLGTSNCKRIGKVS
jgi:hypothetical protein